MVIGVLALQGAFIEHENTLNKLDIDCFEIRKCSDIERDYDGLILPGGESTVMGKLLRESGLFKPLKDKIQACIPVMGTCAGLILLASEIADSDTVHFGTLPVTVKRNAYGRQLGSFYTESNFDDIGVVPMKFIRAPYIQSVKDGVKILAVVENHIIAVRYQNQLGIAYHPELTDSLAVHRYFINMIKGTDEI
ncbi:pyridoxal 5'-phosphate synthase glutaminase subunit PdxT [Anaerocolumna sedimenticola]|uniref:Pyridoxal 5'-phosphate synthase subunit PdxT n=1 Tax=Anaerocolumna sedimenticola TaxID=2696063 RepID=A0A6P1TN57_9FIRM|nr:pyridoxal 5'-phosphate synthase glutaminase subunit PdxT [Anaerocolumna sedimenticola]QHQ62434.1 pyridoxal 5'-phosphate synthase glutaminase subunit PdxT [Anaerocolumna sedimenticola]